MQLSKKLLPGHRSYSLGKLCAEKNIEINGRHRAAGDALATVKLFELLLKENEIRNNSDALKNLKLF
jgi:DNA polymerase-3 subunit epsilon